MENASKALAYLKGRLADTDGGFLMDVEVDRAKLREVVDRLEMLEPVAKTAPFEIGDVVREVGQEELTGTVIRVKNELDAYYEKSYVVKLFNPPMYVDLKTITYYHDEIELMERPEK